MVDAPPAVEALGGGSSSASLEAVPAGDSDALLLLATDHAALRCAAVAYMDGLVAKGRLLHRTRGMAFTEGHLYDGDGKLCCHATGTFKYVLPEAVQALQAAKRTIKTD